MQEPQQRQAQAAIAAQVSQLQQLILASQEAEGNLDAALTAAQAQLVRAETAMNLAAKNEARYRELLDANASAAQTYDMYKTQLEDAQAAVRDQIAALQSQLDSVNVSLRETEIRAPFAGIITKKFVEEGALVSSIVPLLS